MRVGLTGGIACGKSRVLEFFRENGWEIFDSDAFCASIYASPSKKLIAKLKKKWENYPIENNGLLDKKKIAEIVFNNDKERLWLNSIIHPIVLKAMKKATSKTKKIICDVPLLFEAEWQNEFDSIITVWAPDNLRLKRLLNRGMDKKSAIQRIIAQMPEHEKLEKANFGIINTSTIENLKKQCEIIIKLLK